MEFENIQNNLEFNQNNNDYQLENNENELLISNEKPQASFDNEENQLSFDAPYTPASGSNNYEELDNLPSINGVPLIRNKTTEELGIVGTSMTEIELSTDITNPTEIMNFINKSGTYVAKNAGVIGSDGEPMVALGKGQFFSIHNLKDYANEFGLGDEVPDSDNFIDVDGRLIDGEHVTVRIYGNGKVEQLVWLNSENVNDYVKVNINLYNYLNSSYGIYATNGKLSVVSASQYDINNGSDNYKPITSNNIAYAVESKGKNYFPTKTEFTTLETDLTTLKTEIETILESVVSIDE